MCLWTSNAEILTAEEDIEVFKIFKRTSLNNIMSPYQNCIFEQFKNGAVYQEDSFETNFDDIPFIAQLYSQQGFLHKMLKYQIRKGFHSFKSYKDAEFEIFELKKYGSCAVYFIVKCIIPKGTLYVKGLTEEDYPSYCSQIIKIIDEIK